jgi:hypothetical protein
MTTDAIRPEWLPIVEQAERQLGVADLPSLERELGPGVWKLMHAPRRKDGLVHVGLYWMAGTNTRNRRAVRVGGFYTGAMVHIPARNNNQFGMLVDHFTPDGCPVIRVRCSEETQASRLVVVVYEEYRGELLPRPVPYLEGGAHVEIPNTHAQR